MSRFEDWGDGRYPKLGWWRRAPVLDIIVEELNGDSFKSRQDVKRVDEMLACCPPNSYRCSLSRENSSIRILLPEFAQVKGNVVSLTPLRIKAGHVYKKHPYADLSSPGQALATTTCHVTQRHPASHEDASQRPHYCIDLLYQLLEFSRLLVLWINTLITFISAALTDP